MPLNQIEIYFFKGLYMSYQKKRAVEIDDAWLKLEIRTILSREVIVVLYLYNNLYV